MSNKPIAWSEFEWALFLLDQAEQSIVDKLNGQPDARVLALLVKYSDRLRELRREYVIASGTSYPG